jgi:hypothetical protein
MTLYLSGPISGRANYEEEFSQAAEALREYAYLVENPAEIVPCGTAWEPAMRQALARMLECDGLAMLPDWTQSRGARIEVRLARELGMPIKRVADWITEREGGAALEEEEF